MVDAWGSANNKSDVEDLNFLIGKGGTLKMVRLIINPIFPMISLIAFFFLLFVRGILTPSIFFASGTLTDRLGWYRDRPGSFCLFVGGP